MANHAIVHIVLIYIIFFILFSVKAPTEVSWCWNLLVEVPQESKA